MEGIHTWRAYTYGGHAHMEGIHTWRAYTHGGLVTVRGRSPADAHGHNSACILLFCSRLAIAHLISSSAQLIIHYMRMHGCIQVLPRMGTAGVRRSLRPPTSSVSPTIKRLCPLPLLLPPLTLIPTLNPILTLLTSHRSPITLNPTYLLERAVGAKPTWESATCIVSPRPTALHGVSYIGREAHTVLRPPRIQCASMMHTN